jgi:transcriptional regulator with XRE-family HTH domain
MVVGADLRRAREAQRVSLGRLARLISRDKGHLSRVETGSGRDVTPALVRDYERALGVSVVAALDVHPAGPTTRSGDNAHDQARASGHCESPPATDESLTSVLPVTPSLAWDADTLTLLDELGSTFVGVSRRAVLGTVVHAATSPAVPDAQWWAKAARSSSQRIPTDSRLVGRLDVEAALSALQFFSQLDQRHGGGQAKAAVTLFLTSDIAPLLSGRFADESVRKAMFSAASTLAYVAGWMAFDDGDNASAQRLFTSSVKLAAEADDPPMAAHTMRAMAHQALDLGRPGDGLALTTASIEGPRFHGACPRERALLGIVHARALAATGQPRSAARALLRAEEDLAAASKGDAEPSRVFFFGEASLAHETGRTLRNSGDDTGAERELRRSVRLRDAVAFKRTHAVTLGYLGAVQAAQGNLDEACATWAVGLEATEGIRSARARQTVVAMRTELRPFSSQYRAAKQLDRRAAQHLANTAHG